MRWQIEFPIVVYTVDDQGTYEAANQQTAPLTVRNAIAEACWSLGQALSRTADSITIGAEIVVDEQIGEDRKDARKNR